MKELLKALFPKLIVKIKKIIERNRFKNLSSLAIDINPLRVTGKEDLKEIFRNHQSYTDNWEEDHKITTTFELPEMTGGVNSGDQRALYYLIQHFKPNILLEVGTHIGCSTVHIAMALKSNAQSSLTTVDIEDVNNQGDKRWLLFGSNYSPLDLVNAVDYQDQTTFIQNGSLQYLANCTEKYDFIFLDGSHYGPIVYQEIPMALKLLNPDGVILLHDYFPGGRPLWKNSAPSAGVFMAVDRLIKENQNLQILPFGELPWVTKLNSNVTSLALLTRT